jgi:hypothetical protein
MKPRGAIVEAVGRLRKNGSELLPQHAKPTTDRTEYGFLSP